MIPVSAFLTIEVGGLDQLEEDVLDVLTDVAGLGQRGRVGDRERDVEDARQRLRQQRLAAAGRAEQHDVRLLQLDLAVGRVLGHLNALVVVVDGDRERALGVLLADHVLLEDVVDLDRLRQVLELERGRRGQLLVDDLVAEIDALVADVDAGARDQLLDLALRLSAEAAEELLVRVGRACHDLVSLRRLAECLAVASGYDTAGLGSALYSPRTRVPAPGGQVAGAIRSSRGRRGGRERGRGRVRRR